MMAQERVKACRCERQRKKQEYDNERDKKRMEESRNRKPSTLLTKYLIDDYSALIRQKNQGQNVVL